MTDFPDSRSNLRIEIAMHAARLIAEDGLDYASARQKAIKVAFGSARAPRDSVPADQEIQEELRAYLSMFMADTQPAELQRVREVALNFMQEIAEFEPIIYGAVVNGTATKHSDVLLIAFADDEKEIDYFLLNRNIVFDACEDALLNGRTFPAVGFQWQGQWFRLGVTHFGNRRGLLKSRTNNPNSAVREQTLGGVELFQTDLAGLERLAHQAVKSSKPSNA